METNYLLNSLQFGFGEDKLTLQALDKLVRVVHEAFEDKAFAQATLCDLNKAFDCVDLDHFIGKLSYYGFGSLPVYFLKSYLSGRNQKECIYGSVVGLRKQLWSMVSRRDPFLISTVSLMHQWFDLLIFYHDNLICRWHNFSILILF